MEKYFSVTISLTISFEVTKYISKDIIRSLKTFRIAFYDARHKQEL